MRDVVIRVNTAGSSALDPLLSPCRCTPILSVGYPTAISRPLAARLRVGFFPDRVVASQVAVHSETSDSEGEDSRRRFAEKELFLLLLVGIAVLMSLTGYVLIVT